MTDPEPRYGRLPFGDEPWLVTLNHLYYRGEHHFVFTGIYTYFGYVFDIPLNNFYAKFIITEYLIDYCGI